MPDSKSLFDDVADAFRESFENGLMVTGKDPARPGRVRVESSISLPESLVKTLLGDMYDGMVTDRPPRSGRGATFELKGTSANAGSDEGADEAFDDGSTFDDKFDRPTSTEHDDGQI